MSVKTDQFLSRDGLRLFYRHWACKEPKKILCIVHGLGEHSGRYDAFARDLNQNGITVFALDLRGHGHSQGKRGHARSYDLLLNDIEELLKIARSNYTELPMFLLGQSMGGNLVANYVIQMNTNEVVGFLLTAPWFRLSFIPPKWKVQLARTMKSLWPSLTQPNGLDAKDLSHDPKVVEAYNTDPLVHRVISAGLYDAVTQAGEEALRRGNEITIPGLVLHGTSDAIIDWTASEKFCESCDLAHWIPLDGTFHEPLNDSGKQEVILKITSWLLDQ